MGLTFLCISLRLSHFRGLRLAILIIYYVTLIVKKSRVLDSNIGDVHSYELTVSRVSSLS